MAELTGYISSVYIEPGAVVTLKDQYPSANKYTMEVSQSGVLQSLEWQDGKLAIDDTVIGLDTTWSSYKIDEETGKRVIAPTVAGIAGQVLTLKADGTTEWSSVSSDVQSVNGKTGIVVLNSADILMTDGTTTIQSAVDAKLIAPTTAGTAGQVLAVKADQTTEWVAIPSAPVLSVNSKTGAVVLKAADINMADNTTIEDKVNSKITNPTSGTAGQVLTKTATGEEWKTIAEAPVKSVNTKTGDVVLTGEDINIDSARTTKLSTAILGVQVNGTNLTPTNNIINIPLAGSTVLTEENENAIVPGIVNVKTENGIEIDSNGYLQFNDKSLDAISGSKNSALATTTAGTAIGDVYMKNSECYVKTDTGEKLTNLNAEFNNFRAQLCEALGMTYTTSWDSTNNKVVYTFELNY